MCTPLTPDLPDYPTGFSVLGFNSRSGSDLGSLYDRTPDLKKEDVRFRGDRE